MLIKLLLDTSVWLDLCQDHRHAPVIYALEELVKDGELTLVVPDVVVDEFVRNKERVVAAAQKGLQSHFRIVREAMQRFGNPASRDAAIRALNEADHAMTLKSESSSEVAGRLEKLLLSTPPTKISDAIKVRVAERALARKAPFGPKNSSADAAIIEFYRDALSTAPQQQCGFVTHNTKDFSDPTGDRRHPHPDIAELFAPEHSRYWISLADVIHAHFPESLDDHSAEFNFTDEPRRLSEILEAEGLLYRQIWYNRHWNHRLRIESREVKVVPQAEYSRAPYRGDQILDSVWQQALAAAKRTEEEVGKEALGPWDDFEWGMLNGKLSALRWVLGDEWDSLDT